MLYLQLIHGFTPGKVVGNPGQTVYIIREMHRRLDQVEIDIRTPRASLSVCCDPGIVSGVCQLVRMQRLLTCHAMSYAVVKMVVGLNYRATRRDALMARSNGGYSGEKAPVCPCIPDVTSMKPGVFGIAHAFLLIDRTVVH